MVPQSVLRIGNLTLDRDGRKAWLGGAEVPLTFQEFEVLSLLLAQQNIVISHFSICRAIWGAAGSPEIKRLGVVISNLRKKLERLSPYTIETVRSRGYGIVLGESSAMTSSDPIGMHDWHSHRYAHEWMERQDDDSRVYLRHIAHLLPFDTEEDIRVLDLGAGYGALTRLILDAFPHSNVVVHDYAEPMLRRARDYLSGASDAVTYVRGDLLDEDWYRDISGGFDAVVSSIAIHNVRYAERIQAIYRDVFSLVSPGGCFFNADYVTPSGERVRDARRHQQVMEQRYLIRQSTGVWQSIAEVERQVTESDHHGRSRGEVEQASLVDHLAWLEEAGFSQVECFWHDGLRALVGGFKD